jgi:succinate dehydrogenase/fumarate reductase flavoprotein subunit
VSPVADVEVDVLIVGFGAAGASAAIAAHDAGASVAVVEKTASGGGNCVHSGGFLFELDGPQAVEHLDALCFGKTDRAVLEAFARGLPDVAPFRVLDGDRVTGAIVEQDGERRTIAARGGVVLCAGGFEADPELRDTYLPLPLVAVGHQANTGDALRLAQVAGASLWHMSAFFGWPAFVHPEYPAGFTLDVHAPSFICVDGDGLRFADETGWEVHDRVRALTAYLPRRRNRPRMPGWIVFDEAARMAGPLHGIVGSPNGYAWSPDNSAEVDAGWIKRGNDSGELAAATGLEPTALQSTLAGYAAAVSRRDDYEFGRSPDTLLPLLPPLYAIEMTPAVATASGGPRRDAHARVLRPGGSPIPGLFAAGAAGSIWGHLTEHGGGLSDAIVFGRIAGARATAGVAEPARATTG